MSLARRLGIVLSVALPLTLGPGIATAGAATAAGGCTGNPASAINQYCETIPAPTGAKSPVAGTPALRTALPPRVLRQINSPTGSISPAARRQLLTLPAPAGARQARRAGARQARRHGKRAARVVGGFAGVAGAAGVTKRASIGGASVWSLSLMLILILVAIALILSTAAFLRWRAHRRAA